jgi:hypothetical protein
MRVAVLVSLLSAASVWAMSARVANVAELARRADLVVLGRAVASESFWREGRIMTRTTVVVDEVWNGDAQAGHTIDMLTLGGVVSNLGQQVSGSPVIACGERLALILAGTSAAGYFPLDLWQGVFRVAGATDQARVTRPAPEAARSGEAARAIPATLAALRQVVLEAVRAER